MKHKEKEKEQERTTEKEQKQRKKRNTEKRKEQKTKTNSRITMVLASYVCFQKDKNLCHIFQPCKTSISCETWLIFNKLVQTEPSEAATQQVARPLRPLARSGPETWQKPQGENVHFGMPFLRFVFDRISCLMSWTASSQNANFPMFSSVFSFTPFQNSGNIKAPIGCSRPEGSRVTSKHHFWVTSKHHQFGSLPNTFWGSLPNTRLGFRWLGQGNLGFRGGGLGTPLTPFKGHFQTHV